MSNIALAQHSLPILAQRKCHRWTCVGPTSACYLGSNPSPTTDKKTGNQTSIQTETSNPHNCQTHSRHGGYSRRGRAIPATLETGNPQISSNSQNEVPITMNPNMPKRMSTSPYPSYPSPTRGKKTGDQTSCPTKTSNPHSCPTHFRHSGYSRRGRATPVTLESDKPQISSNSQNEEPIGIHESESSQDIDCHGDGLNSWTKSDVFDAQTFGGCISTDTLPEKNVPISMNPNMPKRMSTSPYPSNPSPTTDKKTGNQISCPTQTINPHSRPTHFRHSGYSRRVRATPATLEPDNPQISSNSQNEEVTISSSTKRMSTSPYASNPTPMTRKQATKPAAQPNQATNTAAHNNPSVEATDAEVLPSPGTLESGNPQIASNSQNEVPISSSPKRMSTGPYASNSAPTTRKQAIKPAAQPNQASHTAAHPTQSVEATSAEVLPSPDTLESCNPQIASNSLNEDFNDDLKAVDRNLRDAKDKFSNLKEEVEVADKVIRNIAGEIQEQEFRGRVGDIVYASTGVVGGGFSLVGFILAPFTAGGSLLLTAIGAAIGISSAAAGVTHDIVKNNIVNSGFEEAIKLLESIDKKWKELDKLLKDMIPHLNKLNPSMLKKIINSTNIWDAGIVGNGCSKAYELYKASKAVHLIRVGKFEKMQNYLLIGKVTDKALTNVGSNVGVKLVKTTKGVTRITSKVMIPVTIIGILIDVIGIAKNSYKIHKKEMNKKAEELMKSADKMMIEMKKISEILDD